MFLKIHLPLLLGAMKILTRSSEHTNAVLPLEEEHDVTDLGVRFQWLKHYIFFWQIAYITWVVLRGRDTSGVQVEYIPKLSPAQRETFTGINK